MKKFIVSIMVVTVIACVAGLATAGTKYASDVTAAGAAVTFKAKDTGWNVKTISAKTGTSDKTVDVYARKDQALNPQAVTAYSSTTCTVVNTGVSITNSDKVVYQHVNGLAEYRTVSSATATAIVLSSAITGSWASGDKIYEIGQVGSFDIGVTNATTGKASITEAGASLVLTPGDSPLYVINEGETNNIITVTAE